MRPWIRPSLIAVISLLAACEQTGDATAQTRPVGEPALADGDRSPVQAASDPEAPPEDMPPDQPEDEDVPVDPEVPAEPEVPVAPADYGLIAPPIDPPTEEQLTMHGVAGYEVVAIYSKPDVESPRLGYLRLGTRFRVTEKVEGTGCSKGWHGLPNGGFACVGKGLLVGKTPPYLHDPPPPPNVDEPLPYEYAYVRKWNTPMFWRVPKPEEQRIADEQRALLEAKREGKPLPAPKAEGTNEPTAPAATKPVVKAESGAKANPLGDLPAPDGDETKPEPAKARAEPAKGEPAKSEPAKAEPAKGEPAKGEPTKGEPAKGEPAAGEPLEVVEPIKLPLNPQTPWLEKGFFVSLAGKVHEEGHTWWRTARGAFVPAADAYKYGAKDWSGVPLPEDTDFPFGYAMAKETKVYELGDNGKLKHVDKLERRTFLDFTEETEVGGKAYMMTTDGRLVRKDDVRIAQPQPLPTGLQPWERWIDVSLEQQMLVAYEGERPVYVTLVSSGRKGSKEEPFETPTGRWRIRSKHISSTMDGDTASDGNYSIQDVPWAMFFEGSYALHGAFWHESFGRVRSHGCVNLGPTDARWLFHFTTPFLPEGWHGVHAHEGSPGTTVIVRQ